MRRPFRSIACLACLLVLSAGAVAQDLSMPTEFVEFSVDSGPLDGADAEAVPVFQHLVDLGPGRRWMQLYVSAAELPPGSFMRVTSLTDGESQSLTGTQLFDEWYGHTAYFNGSQVVVELIAGPGTTGNQLVLSGALSNDPVPVLEALASGPAPLEQGGPDTICGALDDRVPSSDPAVGRVVFSGDVCSGFIIADAVPFGTDDKFHLTAGHCLFGSSNVVMQFDVPLQDVFCQLIAPPIAKQFSVVQDFEFSLGTGDDWGVFRCHPNSNTGLTTFEEQAASYTRATSLPASGTVTVTGHGSDGNESVVVGGNSNCGCDPKTFSGTWNTIQQTESGPLVAVTGTLVEYMVDTCGGSSGSPVIHEVSGEAIAIHHDGFCHTVQGTNIGTATNHPEIDATIAFWGGAPTWQDIEEGLPGIFGQSNLWGDGTLLAGDPVTLQLFGTIPNATTWLVVGFSYLGGPFKGGTLVPNPDLVLSGFTTDGNGILILPATWPAGVPSAFEVFFQGWYEDFTGPVGFAASNGLLGTTP